MTAAPRPPELTREQQVHEAIGLVHGLLGDRPATKVQVEVTRGGTYRIVAETGEGGVKARHDWRP